MVKMNPTHGTKAYSECGDMAVLILNHGTKWRWVVLLIPWPYYAWKKSTWYLL